MEKGFESVSLKHRNFKSATESHRKSTEKNASVKFCVNLWLILIMTILFCFSGCTGKKVEKFSAGESFPDQIVKNFTMDKYDVETRKWTFFAVRGDIYENRKIINARNIKTNFYEDNGKTGSVISANKAVIKTDTGDIKAEGNVIIYSLTRNTTIFMETLNYNEKSGKVSSDSFIRQEKPDATVTGNGLEANSDLSNITILHNVKVVKK